MSGGLAFATVAGSLEEHDVVHGIVLPKVLDEHPDLTHRQREYAKPDLKTSDFTFAPVHFNHNYKKNHTGVTIAWRVREVYQASANLLDQPGTVRVETLHKMHAEPADDNQSAEANFQRSQREMLMRGIHRGLSLGHSFGTEYLGDAGVIDPSQAGKPGILVKKNIIEISTCKRGKRDGSEILEYLPCRRSLEQSRESEIREFVNVYHYTAPADDLHSSDAAQWRSYINHLWSEVDQRRKALVAEPGYAQSLRARGVVAASADTDEWLEATASLPWSFLGGANGTQPDHRQTTMSAPVGSTQPAATTTAANQQQQPPVAASNTQQTAGATNTAPTLNQTGAPQGSSSMMAVDTPPTAPPPGGYQSEAAQQAANNFAAFKQQKEYAEAAERRAADLAARLAEYETRDNESRKRKQQDDEEREKAAFLAKKEELRLGIVKSGAMSKENGTNAQQVDRFVNDQLSDLDSIASLADLQKREQRFSNDCETLVQASRSARDRFEESQRAEWGRQQREIEATLSAQPASSIMSSGGFVANQPAAASSSNRFSFADWNTPQQQPASGAVSTTNYAPVQTQGTVLASANSFSFLGGHQSRSLDTSTPAAKKKVELPAVDVAATDNIGQALDHMIYKSANAGTFVLPSRHQLLTLGTNTETRVLNSVNGPVEQSREVPRLQFPLPETSYSWKTTAPELHEKLTLEVKKLLANGSNRISPAEMNEMYRAGRLNEHGQAINMIPFGGPMEQDGWSTATMDQWRSSRGFGSNRRAVF